MEEAGAMDFTTINSLNSYISGLKMQGLWHLRQQNGASHQDEITVDGVTFHRRDETLASIRAKLDAGGSLTEEERAYLRQHDPPGLSGTAPGRAGAGGL